MTNFALARENMIDGQIHPNGVVDQNILSAYATIPREIFVEEKYKPVAYTDEAVKSFGRIILEPTHHARMVQALAPQKTDIALDIGGGAGYSAAILSSLVSTVFAVEETQDLIKKASTLWNNLEITNAIAVKAKLTEGCKKHAPYNCIFLNGAVSSIPEKILDQLAPEGRLVCILQEKEETLGRAVLVEKSKSGQCSTLTLFEAQTVYLSGFEPEETFVF